MIFSPVYRKKVFDVMKDNLQIDFIMKALESNDFKKQQRVRNILESELYRIEKYFNPPKEITDDGERSIHNSAVQIHKEIQELYNEFMEITNQELDKAKVKVNG